MFLFYIQLVWSRRRDKTTVFVVLSNEILTSETTSFSQRLSLCSFKKLEKQWFIIKPSVLVPTHDGTAADIRGSLTVIGFVGNLLFPRSVGVYLRIFWTQVLMIVRRTLMCVSRCLCFHMQPTENRMIWTITVVPWLGCTLSL